MPLIDRNDLKYDYTWSSEPASKPRDSTLAKGDTSSGVFRSNEGDEVLSFINDYTQKEKITDKQEALEIERILRDELKNRNMTRKETRLWLNEHLKKERV